MFILLGGLLLLTPRACVANNALMLRVVNLVHNFVVLLLYGSEIWGAYNGIYFPSVSAGIHLREQWQTDQTYDVRPVSGMAF